MYRPICDENFDATKINYNNNGEILYGDSYLVRTFTSICTYKSDFAYEFYITDPEWIKVHNNIKLSLKKANVFCDAEYERFDSKENKLILNCKTVLDRKFPLYEPIQIGDRITGLIQYYRTTQFYYDCQIKIIECHKYEYPKTYSWGELYETLKDMEEKGDSVEDPLFRRILTLFPRLESSPLADIERILEKETFTETELNRINSPCFDGLIACLPHNMTKIYENNYTETYKFYLDKGLQLDNFAYILTNYGSIKLLQIYLDRGGKIPDGIFFDYLKKGKILSLELCQFLIDNNATLFDTKLFAAILQRTNLSVDDIRKTRAFVQLFLTKGLKPDESILSVSISVFRYDIAEILIQDGVKLNNNAKFLIYERNLYKFFEENMKIYPSIENWDINSACAYRSFELAQKMAEFGIKGDENTLTIACSGNIHSVDLQLVKFLLENGYNTIAIRNYSVLTLDFLLQNGVIVDDNFIRSVCRTRNESLLQKLIDRNVCIDKILDIIVPNVSFVKKLVEKQLREKYDFVEKKIE